LDLDLILDWETCWVVLRSGKKMVTDPESKGERAKAGPRNWAIGSRLHSKQKGEGVEKIAISKREEEGVEKKTGVVAPKLVRGTWCGKSG